MGQCGHGGGNVARGEPHHGAAVGIKAHGADDRAPEPGCALDGRLHFLVRGDGLNPEHIRPAAHQGLGLLAKCLACIRDLQRPYGSVDLAGGANGARYYHLAAALAHHLARDAGCGLIEFRHPSLVSVEFQSVAVTTEAVGENDVGTGFDEAAVIGRDPVGMVDVPGLGRVAGLQAHRKQVGAGGAIGEKPRPGAE